MVRARHFDAALVQRHARGHAHTQCFVHHHTGHAQCSHQATVCDDARAAAIK